jgi:hypothetical protein
MPYESSTSSGSPTVCEYTVDLDDLGAIKVAHQIGLAAEQAFKTLGLPGQFSLAPFDHGLTRWTL